MEVDGAEPRVFANDEIALFDGYRGGAAELDTVVVDPRGDGVADEQVVVPVVAPAIVIDVGDAADPGRTVRVFNHRWREAEPVVGFSKTRIDASL